MGILNKGIGAKFRWFYPFAGAIIGTAIVITNAWSVFYPYIMDHFGLTNADLPSIAAGSSFVGFGNFIVAPITAAFIVDRFGPKILYALSIILELIGLACFNVMVAGGVGDWADSQIWWYVGCFVLAWGIGFYTATANPLAAKWCPDKTGLAVGIVNIGPALGPLWATWACALLIPDMGIGATLNFMIILGVCFTLVFGVLTQRNPDPGWVPEGWTPAAASVADDEGVTLGQAIKTPQFWCIFVIIFLVTFAGFTFAMNLSTIIIEGCVTIGGMEEAVVRVAVVAVAMSIANIINAIARPLWGAVATKLGSPWLALKVLYAGFAIALLIMTMVYTNATGAIFGTCLVYLFFGGTSPIHQSAGAIVFGQAHAGEILNVLLLATGLGWICGPYVGAVVKAGTGSYIGAFYLAIGMIIVALIIVFLIAKRPVKKMDGSGNAPMTTVDDE